MNPIPVLGIPHYNRSDLTLRCIQSIDYRVDLLVIIDQGPEPLEWPTPPRDAIPACVKSFEISRHRNYGVAGAWNEIVINYPAPWWMIVNNDIQFTTGDLEKMTAVAWDHPEAGIFYGNHGASWFAVTQKGIFEVGLWDQNFIAYLEDCCWGYRCELLGVKRLNVQDCHAIHGEMVRGHMEGSRTVNDNDRLASENSRTHGLGFEYYKLKWGGLNGQEVYKTPFGDPNWPVWAWRFDPKLRKRMQWKV